MKDAEYRPKKQWLRATSVLKKYINKNSGNCIDLQKSTPVKSCKTSLKKEKGTERENEKETEQGFSGNEETAV